MIESWKTIAIQAAIKAGEVIMDVYRRDFDVAHKSDNSPLTEADLNAHETIVGQLQQTGIPILSEEGSEIPFETRIKWDQFWMVDPLDGTKEFVKRNGEFTVNIALMVGHRPVFGVIYVPVHKTIYAGGSDDGASYKLVGPKDDISWEKLINKVIPLSRKLKNYNNLNHVKVVTSRSHLNLKTQEFVKDLQNAGKNTEVVPSGSAYKFCLVAEGTADVYPRFGPCMEWDTAAGDAICEGVGGAVYVEHTSERLFYNKESLFSPNFVAH
ncbi:3'(2'), 5'-bisphosphate nucleotidase [Dokdonia sp. Hel_I_63]|uniref:3'(2'),5'-bisphosphate nucleotidase CysQ n=1 Tax=Dokdonia sp. Hel_I_63 TaxID=1249996 RepID=UPI001199A7E0|nr:3'(2'),5'-bisphosphate nucleotidase CysQ [Dokdonia sp. Hel_I_63]TVZ22986.1 3'(2'), 5'-bisphosphate nucleotidase [Dokdonia sp. Hel_I_63]